MAQKQTKQPKDLFIPHARRPLAVPVPARRSALWHAGVNEWRFGMSPRGRENRPACAGRRHGLRQRGFIVIEGIDFTGKTTQSKLLLERLRKRGIQTSYFDFPQYKQRSCTFVEDYLVGEFGDATTLDPKISSLFFALDRFAAKNKLIQALAGGVVVANRYSTSNFGHQATKCKTVKEKMRFWKWLQRLEYNFLKLPKPNIVFILMLPLAVSLKLGKSRKSSKYISTHGKTTDMHQQSMKHLAGARKNYLLLGKMYPKTYRIIDCYDKKKNYILPPEIIANKIWAVLQELIH